MEAVEGAVEDAVDDIADDEIEMKVAVGVDKVAETIAKDEKKVAAGSDLICYFLAFLPEFRLRYHKFCHKGDCDEYY